MVSLYGPEGLGFKVLGSVIEEPMKSNREPCSEGFKFQSPSPQS